MGMGMVTHSKGRDTPASGLGSLPYLCGLPLFTTCDGPIMPNDENIRRPITLVGIGNIRDLSGREMFCGTIDGTMHR